MPKSLEPALEALHDRRAAVSVVVQRGRDDDGLLAERVLCVWNRRYRTWSLPGGMVEEGESPRDAQRRELEEETGLFTRSAVLAHEGPHGLVSDRPGRAAIVCVFAVDVIGEPREVEQGCPVTWMSVQEFISASAFGDFYRSVLPGVVTRMRILTWG